MKAILASMVLASATAMAQQAAPEPTLKPGSEVKLEAVTSAKWVQGEPLKAFEPGKVYVFECWATWCGPCVGAIPHVNELHKKYFDKGLRVYGMNVWEDGQDKVEKFVKGKGEGMSYPVAYTGKGSAFENDWLKAAGVRGIPHAFIVKDGKIVLTSHPSELTDPVIETLLSGDEGARKAVGAINAAKSAQEDIERAQKHIGKVMRAFRAATDANDTETMAAKLAEFEKLEPDSPALAAMKLDLLLARKDWPAAAKAVEEMPEGHGKQASIAGIASNIVLRPDGDYPVDFIKTISKFYAADDPKSPSSPFRFTTLTALQWKSGDKEAALASAKKAVESVAKQEEGGEMPAAPFEKFAKAVEEGNLPTMQDLSRWIHEETDTKAVPATRIQPAPAKE